MLETYVVLVIKFVALALVALRISWFLIEDIIISDQRAWLVVRAQKKGRPKLALFWKCPFCLGLWSQIALVAVVAQFTSLPWPGLWVLALNMVVAPAHHLLDQAIRK